MPGPTPLTAPNDSSIAVRTSTQWRNKVPTGYNGTPQIHSPNCPFPFDDHHQNLIHPYQVRPHSPPQTASGCNQPFCHCSHVRTDRWDGRRFSYMSALFAIPIESDALIIRWSSSSHTVWIRWRGSSTLWILAWRLMEQVYKVKVNDVDELCQRVQSVKICQVLSILHKLICRNVANFGTRYMSDRNFKLYLRLGSYYCVFLPLFQLPWNCYDERQIWFIYTGTRRKM